MAADEETKKDVAASYNKLKVHDGQVYRGMAVGRRHKWYYEQGEWKERKVTPDKWEISYAVNKKRAGKAPEGSGAPVGTEYNWYILASQKVKKLDANTYSTSLEGLKVKVAHMSAKTGKWSASEKAQTTKVIKILEEFASQLRAQLEEGIPLTGTEEPIAPKAGRRSGKRRSHPVEKPTAPERKATS
jgi:hypothetical protein